MANYINGKDVGTVSGHALADSGYQNGIGPHRETYNGLLRTNLGYTENDETADTILTHISNYNRNLDILLTAEDAAVEPLAEKVALRDATGSVAFTVMKAAAIDLVGTQSRGLLFGGSLEGNVPQPYVYTSPITL